MTLESAAVDCIKAQASDHAVKSVTLFRQFASNPSPKSAEVVRTFSIELAAGENRVHIEGLSSSIHPDSVRVAGLGEHVRLFDVSCSVRQPVHPAEDSPAETLRRLEAKRLLVTSEKRVREHEADMLVGYGQSLSSATVTPEDASSFLASFIQSGSSNLAAASRLAEELVHIDREIAAVKKQMGERRGSAHGQVTAVLSAQRATSVQLRLAYIVAGASWVANYDLHATTESGRPSSNVKLHFRAMLTQSTGEDWTDAALIFSTAEFSLSRKSLPVFKPLRVRPVVQSNAFFTKANTNNAQQQQQQQQQQQGGASLFGLKNASNNNTFQNQSGSLFSGPTQGMSSAVPPPPAQQPVGGLFGGGLFGQASNSVQGAGMTNTFAPPPGIVPAAIAASNQESAGDDFIDVGDTFDTTDDMPAPASTSQTVVSESPLSTTYTVEGQSTVPSDGLAHQVLVAVLPFAATVSHVAVPRVDPVAYLQCEVKNTSEYRLLPGVVSVFMDDSLVSTTSIQDVGTGDTFTCTLGADPAVRLTFARTVQPGKTEGSAFAERTRTVPYTVRTTIENRHRFALPGLVVRDAVPLAGEDTRVHVVLRKPVGLADAKESDAIAVDGNVTVSWAKGGQKVGQVVWKTGAMESGAKVALEMEFEVRGPPEMQWALRMD